MLLLVSIIYTIKSVSPTREVSPYYHQPTLSYNFDLNLSPLILTARLITWSTILWGHQGDVTLFTRNTLILVICMTTKHTRINTYSSTILTSFPSFIFICLSCIYILSIYLLTIYFVSFLSIIYITLRV
jgi:hypothetical protein